MPIFATNPQDPAAPKPFARHVPTSFFRAASLIAIKDLQVEWRSREIFYSSVLFAVLMVVIFSVALVRHGPPHPDTAAGILWSVILFSGTIGLSRMFDREREGLTHQALLLCPINRASIYVGKVLSIFLFSTLIECALVPCLFLLFQIQVASYPILISLLLLGTLGFSSIGSLFAATLFHCRSRDVLLNILLFPIATPLVLAGAKGTADILGIPGDPSGAMIWLKFVLVFDLVCLTLALWTFEPLTRGD